MCVCSCLLSLSLFVCMLNVQCVALSLSIHPSIHPPIYWGVDGPSRVLYSRAFSLVVLVARLNETNTFFTASI